MRYFLFGGRPDRRLERDLNEALHLVTPTVLAGRIGAVIDCDVSDALSQVRVPIIYMQAQFDRLVGPSACEQMKKIRPEIEVVAIHAPHLVLQLEPQRGAQTIMQFIARVSHS